MRKALLAIAALCCGIVAMMLAAAPASAQATRTWVSGVGDDANPCSRTAPCKTFAGAISKTAPAGEINVLDPGGFGAVTIIKSITISSVGFEGGVLVSGTNGIVVAAGAGDVVTLEGLDIEGLGTGINGVSIISGAQTYITRCKIHHFTNNGVNLASSTPNSRVVIQDSFIYQNGTNGTANTGGLLVHQGNGVANTAVVLHSVLDNNANFATSVTAPSNLILSGVTLIGSAAAINNTTNATVTSYGNNVIRGTGVTTDAQILK